MTGKLEYCRYCDEATGHGGIHDDSNYLESGVGPLCDSCYDASPDGMRGRLDDTIDRLRSAECGKCGRSLAPDGDCHGCRADRLEVKLAAVREVAERFDYTNPEKVICRKCMNKITLKLEAMIAALEERGK